MGLCATSEEEPGPDENPAVEMPEVDIDPLEALRKLIEEARGELTGALEPLELSIPQVRYLRTVLSKFKQCNQELLTKFDDECELHKAVEYHIAEADSLDIRKACYGMGTNETLLAEVIVSRLSDQLKLVDDIYLKDYDKTLEQLINKEGRSLLGLLTGGLSDLGKFLSYRVTPQPRRDALLLKKCMNGLGCADKPLVEILSTRTNEELKLAAVAYQEAFGEDMVERVKSETGGMMKRNYGDWIDTLVEFDRDETENVPDNCDELAERLYKAGIGKTMGCDEEVFLEILCKANEPTIIAITEAYAAYKGKGRDLVKDVASEMSGDLEFSVLARVRPKLDFLSKRLYGACKGMGTDEEIIARILGCLTNSEVALLVTRYEEYYADKSAPFNNFRALMESELSGDFLNAIIQCLENPSPKGHWVIKERYAANADETATAFQSEVTGAYTTENAIELGKSALDGPIEVVGMGEAKGLFLCPDIDDPYDASGPVTEVKFDREYLLESEVEELEAGQELLDAIKAKTEEFANAHSLNETVIGACKTEYDNAAYQLRYNDSQAKQLMDDNHNMIEFSVERSVKTVREACEGWGADEHRLIKVLCSLNKRQLFKVDALYKETYGKTLKEEMDGELSGFFGNAKYFAYFLDVLLVPPAEYDAKLLLDAMQGWGTDESLLTEVLCTRTNLELKRAKQKFEEKQSKTVEQWVTSETKSDGDGSYCKFLLRCLKADRKELVVDEQIAIDQAAALGEAFSGDEFDEAFEILATASPEQLELIKGAYDGDLMEVIKDKLSGDCEKAVLLRCTSKYEFYARKLIKAWKGMGTDERATSRVFGRSTKADIKKIAAKYTEITGVDFKEAIESEVSGIYKKALMTYVFNDPPPVSSKEEIAEGEEEVPAEEEEAPAEE